MKINYEARIQRAKQLKVTYPFAAEILTFYGEICSLQQRISGEVQRKIGNGARLPGLIALREQIDLDLVLPSLRSTLSELATHSPGPLAEYIKEYLRGSPEQWADSLRRYVTCGGTDQPVEDSREELLGHILIEPYAALLAAKQDSPATGPSANLCPHCEARPVSGVLRIEGDGGKRFLLCSFCWTEWEFRRIYCAYCGEVREQSLPVFVAEKFPQLRVEACDTCRHCLRTVDLTKDGNAVPIVDDLAAIPLALWAEEYGYERIHGNLLGT
jgi:formate dehydrogenase accessory protein FdhE